MDTIDLPKVVLGLVKAQNDFDAVAYADCFSENAEVLDEGKTYKGKDEIKAWIEDANKRYQVTMNPVAFTKAGDTNNVLSAEISGSFPGSPLVLQYHLNIVNEQIHSLEITS
ncbi:nuclear transport factor 2 family protein [Flavobacterium sp. ST-75]|uniref:Nuclear transport factor 2 family protein n=1 Tax=Flavobacterium rhizophilum TaxID=3163296 RepID=A0ABW8YGX3_9FLAO